MLTYNSLIELRARLSNGDILPREAKETLWKDNSDSQRSWYTSDWKERRDKVIKDKCEICASTETLTLQHLSHPKRYSDYEREVIKRHTQQFRDSSDTFDKEEFRQYIVLKYEYDPVPLCPNCRVGNPNKRTRKTPQYRCAKCRHEFIEPVYIPMDQLVTAFITNQDSVDVREKCFVSKDKWRNRHNLSSIKYWYQREIVKVNDSESISKEVLLLYLDDNIKYLSFEDTITACRKCAYNLDIKCMDLCPNCKENYKGLQYPTCINCLPDDRRKEVLEQIAEAKQWRADLERHGIG